MFFDPADRFINQPDQRCLEADSFDDIESAAMLPFGAIIFDEVDTGARMPTGRILGE